MTKRSKSVKKTPAKKPVKAVKKSKSPRAGSVAKDVNLLLELKKKLDLASAKLKPLRDRYAAVEEQVLQRYTQEQLGSVKTKKGLVARTETVVPDLKDWNAFWEYAKDQNASELLRKQVNHDAWREHVELGKPVPGVESFTRVGLQVRLGGKKGGVA